MCSGPVGDGAKRTRTFLSFAVISILELSFDELRVEIIPRREILKNPRPQDKNL